MKELVEDIADRGCVPRSLLELIRDEAEDTVVFPSLSSFFVLVTFSISLLVP